MRLVVGITGGSGAVYAVSVLNSLQKLGVETHLVVSKQGEFVMQHECGLTLEDLKDMSSYYYDEQDFAAAISSGSFVTDGMVVVPCSMNTLASIASGITNNLVVRACDVILKERRKLVIVPRETPLSSIHLENMLKLSQMGVTIFPPVPSFYNMPHSVEDIVINTTGRILDQLDIDNQFAKRWQGV